jgi:DNA helicase-2/ATP-dependent DNA helicase PcrA
MSLTRSRVFKCSDALSATPLLHNCNEASLIDYLQGHGYLLDCPRQLHIIQSHEETSLRNGIKPDDTLRWAEWEDRRLDLFRNSGRICFDLFAPLARQLLSGAKRLRERLSSRYPLIIVDEAQDTNNEQWECVRLLSAVSQIICLADPDQMIYGHLPGVNADRLPLIRETLQPLEIDLGDENNTSPGIDIALFARDIYRGKMSQASYKGISIQRFDRKAEKRDKAIRASIPILVKAMEKETGARPDSVGMLAAYARGVAVVSNALQQPKPYTHQVLFDESFALLSARAAAFLLEPRHLTNNTQDVATLLELAATAYQAKGTATGRTLRDRCTKYAVEIRAGKTPAVKVVKAAAAAVAAARAQTMTGDPRKDWSSTKNHAGWWRPLIRRYGSGA